MNRKLHEPIQQHIHQELCNEINETIILIKLHSLDHMYDKDESYRRKMNIERPCPTHNDLIELLTRIHKEMNECKQPFKRHRHGRFDDNV